MARNRDYLERGIRAAEGVPVERLNKKPMDAAWSPAQVYKHLVLTNALYLEKLQVETQGLPLDSSNQQLELSWFGGFLAKQSGPGTNAPSPKALVPPDGMLPGDVVSEWATQQSQLIDLIDGLRNRELNRKFTRNALLPMFRMTLGDVLSILTNHTERHILQIEGRIHGSC